LRFLFETGDDRVRATERERLDRHLTEIARPYR
jgi:hypothetical protein